MTALTIVLVALLVAAVTGFASVSPALGREVAGAFVTSDTFVS